MRFGPDRRLWFTEQIGRITARGVVTEFDLPHPNSAPNQIAEGPDGHLWFSEFAGSRIGKISHDGVLLAELVLRPGSMPVGIIIGPDGNVWFTEREGTGSDGLPPMVPSRSSTFPF